MARIWKEKRNHRYGLSPMWPGGPGYKTAEDNLLTEIAYFVKVCGFTFEFWSLDQIRVTLEYYSQKIHPSSRLPKSPPDHEEWQRWYERLPGELMKNEKRLKVVAALQQALEKFSGEEDSVTANKNIG